MDLQNIGGIIMVVLAVMGAVPAVLFALIALLKIIPGDQKEQQLEAIANTLQKLVNMVPKK